MATSNKHPSARRKLALVVGNGNYTQPHNKLTQSAFNADDLSNLLKSIRFDVTLASNLSREKMITSIIDFGSTIKNDDLILFYFFGHGYQVDGGNYLLPVDDQDIKTHSDVEYFAVNLDLIIEKLSQNNSHYVSIFIVDCCRSYSLNGSRTSNTDIDSKGLQEIHPPNMTFIQFAFDSSQRAGDVRETDRNSLFTKHLLKNITKKNVDIREMFRRIADEVDRESNGKQKPLSMDGCGRQGKIYLNPELVPLNDDPWDEKTEGSLASIKTEQAKLKAYFDSFPNVEGNTIDQEKHIKEAEHLTKSILRNVPSGNDTERNTACHVLANVLAKQNVECLFFDSTRGMNLHDASTYLAEIDLEDKPLVLKLSSSEGLGGSPGPKTLQGEIRYVQALCRAIDQKQYLPVIDDIEERLSKAYEVDRKYITLKTIFVGSFNVVYIVKEWTKEARESPKKLKALKQQFEGFVSAKSHLLLSRPAFDISFFDERGNKRFPMQSSIYHIGPPGRTMPYTQPGGWVRFGLKAVGRYKDGDRWLDPFQDPQNWYRAFHGTKNATRTDFRDTNAPDDQQYACVDAMADIHKNGFQQARATAYGPGVYCSPDPKYPEQYYVRAVDIDTRRGKKKYKCMLQVAVNPSGVIFTPDSDIWVVSNPENIRSYGILIKQV